MLCPSSTTAGYYQDVLVLLLVKHNHYEAYPKLEARGAWLANHFQVNLLPLFKITHLKSFIHPCAWVRT